MQGADDKCCRGQMRPFGEQAGGRGQAATHSGGRGSIYQNCRLNWPYPHSYCPKGHASCFHQERKVSLLSSIPPKAKYRTLSNTLRLKSGSADFRPIAICSILLTPTQSHPNQAKKCCLRRHYIDGCHTERLQVRLGRKFW